MPRVVSPEVLEIIEIANPNVSLDPFIVAASLVVDRHLVSQNLSISELKEIERWLAAHFTAARFPRKQSDSVTGASVSFQGASGLGLDGTVYGQTAKQLDWTGTLAAVDQQTQDGGAGKAAFLVD
ncbi:MAG: hypothetical protein ACRERD_08090 [Candidatus Binatia bacterium]